MKFIKFILPILLVFQIFAYSQNLKAAETVSLDGHNCKTVGRKLAITVCVDEETEAGAKLPRRLKKAVNKALKQLVRSVVDQSEEEVAANIISPSAYGDSSADDEPNCSNYGCTSPSDWDGLCCGAESYCDAVPDDSRYCELSSEESQ